MLLLTDDGTRLVFLLVSEHVAKVILTFCSIRPMVDTSGPSLYEYKRTLPWMLFKEIDLSQGDPSQEDPSQNPSQHDPASDIIKFADPLVKELCVKNWDSDGDGELSKQEAAAVKTLGQVFQYQNIKTFDELQYFTGLSFMGSALNDGVPEFYKCTALTSVVLPPLFDIGRSFYGCTALTSISIVEKDIFAMTSPAGCNCIISKERMGYEQVTLVVGCKSTVIPSKVKVIADYAFGGMATMESITIPANVTEIGNRAFVCCTCLMAAWNSTRQPMAGESSSR